LLIVYAILLDPFFCNYSVYCYEYEERHWFRKLHRTITHHYRFHRMVVVHALAVDTNLSATFSKAVNRRPAVCLLESRCVAFYRWHETEDQRSNELAGKALIVLIPLANA